MTDIAIHAGLRELADDYDGFIVDLWGVLHDGVQAFPAALDCLEALRRRDKRIVILSNAPRRVDSVVERNAELGIQDDHFDAVLSSGEEAWRHLSERPDAWYRGLGRRCLHIGPERDHGMREGLDFDFVDDVADADFLLNTGAGGPQDRVEDFGALLRGAFARGLPMVCANPDLEVVRGGRREICAGAIAVYYEEMGGEVRYHGKPARDIFDSCVELLGLDDRRRIAAIGDSLRTDVAGARAAGIDAIFITGGIHAEELRGADSDAPDPARLAALCEAAGVWPTAALPHLRW